MLWNKQKPMVDINGKLLSTIHRMFRDSQDQLLKKIDCAMKDFKKDITTVLRNTASTPTVKYSQAICNQTNKTEGEGFITAIEDDRSTEEPTDDYPVRFLQPAPAEERSAGCSTDYQRLDYVAVHQIRSHSARNSSSFSTMQSLEAVSPFFQSNLALKKVYIKENVIVYIVILCSTKKWEDHLKAKWKLDMEPWDSRGTRSFSPMIVKKPIPILKRYSFPSQVNP